MSVSVSKANLLKMTAGVAAATMMFAAQPVIADDWVAVKLRGNVFTLVSGEWQRITRGAVVSDSRAIRTAKDGRVQFRRDNETIDVAPLTQISIVDREGEKFTVVKQRFGEVSIEAERREVQHFVVENRFLAAVVKGTRFTVNADDSGATVSVVRGQVQVRDQENHTMVNVDRGQTAGTGENEDLEVSGWGEPNEIVSFAGDAAGVNVTIVVPGKNGNSAKNNGKAEDNADNVDAGSGNSADKGNSTDKGNSSSSKGNSASSKGNSAASKGNSSSAAGDASSSNKGKSSSGKKD